MKHRSPNYGDMMPWCDRLNARIQAIRDTHWGSSRLLADTVRLFRAADPDWVRDVVLYRVFRTEYVTVIEATAKGYEWRRQAYERAGIPTSNHLRDIM